MVPALNREDRHKLGEDSLFGLGFDSEGYHHTSSNGVKKLRLNVK